MSPKAYKKSAKIDPWRVGPAETVATSVIYNTYITYTSSYCITIISSFVSPINITVISSIAFSFKYTDCT